ncbi:hypothetical protein Pelo_17127 [Pelomyxa schiedti]|nr:hypothetical protein Pelo_17127 [Pelomyxa schiedti]
MKGMRTPVIYGDFNVKVKDFFSKDYADKTKGEAKLHPAKPVTLGLSATHQGDGAIVGVVSPKIVYGWRGLTADVSADLSTDPNQRIKASFKGTSTRLPGTKLILDHDAATPLSLGLEFLHRLFTLGHTLKMEPTATAIGFSATSGYKGFVAGGKVEFALPKEPSEASHEPVPAKHVRDAEFQFGYGIGLWEATAYIHKKGKVIGASYYHELPAKKLTLGVDGNFNRTKKVSTTNISVGAAFTPDPNTTIKVKMSTDHVLGLSFIQQTSKYSKITLSALANMGDLKPSGNHKFGVSLVLND